MGTKVTVKPRSDWRAISLKLDACVSFLMGAAPILLRASQVKIKK